jgi:ketosteroid isomerase-like protein
MEATGDVRVHTRDKRDDEAELRETIDERVRAVRAKDVEGLMSGYAREVVTFDMVVPLANKGADAVRKRVVEWFSSFETPIDYELRAVDLSVDGEVAFDHHFTRVRGTSKSGATIDMWFRETAGYRKIDGRWKITHQHSSVPFDMTTGKARLDLEP